MGGISPMASPSPGRINVLLRFTCIGTVDVGVIVVGTFLNNRLMNFLAFLRPCVSYARASLRPCVPAPMRRLLRSCVSCVLAYMCID